MPEGDHEQVLQRGGPGTGVHGCGSWSGINGVTMLAASVPAQDNEQNDLFYSGLLLGVAAGAWIGCVTELLQPAWRKGTDERAANQPGK